MGELEKQKVTLVEQPALRSHILQPGTGAKSITNALGIRQSYFEKIEGKLGTLGEKDTFSLVKLLNGGYLLTKSRKNLQVSAELPKEAVYQAVEQGPVGFPSITFQRMPTDHAYLLTGKHGEQIGKNSIIIPAAELDTFKRAVNNISGQLVTECGARKALNALACTIEDNNQFKETAVTVNSNTLFDIIPTNISMHEFKNTVQGISNVDIIQALVQSLYPESTANQSKVAKK